MSDAPQYWSVAKMYGVAAISRLTTILAAAAAFTLATGLASARDTTHGKSVGLAVAIVSNGVVTYKIPNGPGGLELSSNGPGTITVTSGSNSVTVPGPSLTLSGAVALAPFSTPGVMVTPNGKGGYTVVLETLLSVLPDPEMPEPTEAASRLANDLAQNLANDLAKELADADFGDRANAPDSKTPDSTSACACAHVTADRCVAPYSNNSASP